MSVSQCKALTKSGEPCKARPTADGFCSIHSEPGRAAELGRRSGESRRLPESEPLVLSPPQTADDLHRCLGLVFSKVSAGEMNVNVGRVLGYVASVLVKTTELSDHEGRLRAIEQRIRSLKTGGTQE
jgi:hypothetical protein